MADPPTPPETIAGLAATIGWRLPRRVVAVALAAPAGVCSGALAPLPPDVLVDLGGREPCLLMPDPDGPGRRLDARGRPAQVAGDDPARRRRRARLAGRGRPGGPARPGGRARCAGRAGRSRSRSATRPASPLDGIVRCDEQLATLVLLADAELARLLSGQLLAPLRGLRPEQADRLAETLLAWLESADNAGVAAGRLHVHPQTVRYRLRQLTELFGDGLSDPDSRFALQIALRVRRLAT